MSEPRVYRCGTAARWLPRALGACTLIAATILSTRIYAGVAGSGWSHSRTLVVMLGAMAALVIVRGGGMVRAEFRIGPDALHLRVGKHERELPYEQLVAMRYETPFVKAKQWLPAMVLDDRFGKRWRIPALLDEGAEFLQALIAASGREDLGQFAEVYGLPAKMARVRSRLVWGYSIGLALIAAALLYASLTGPPS